MEPTPVAENEADAGRRLADAWFPGFSGGLLAAVADEANVQVASLAALEVADAWLRVRAAGARLAEARAAAGRSWAELAEARAAALAAGAPPSTLVGAELAEAAKLAEARAGGC